jgi:putative Mg2+ transporter-C (MgtC) family protein
MLTFEQMLVRLVIALALGAILGIERELVGKEAGVRTEMLVASGAALFTMAALALPYVVATSPENLNSIIASGGFLGMAANIVVGIGFLGAGLIFKTDHPHNVTTAALVWMTAALGILVGIGLTGFATTATVLLAILLYVLRGMDISVKRTGQEKSEG